MAAEEGFEPATGIAEAARPGFHLVFDRGSPRVGASKLGGWPDLPAEVAWPTFRWIDENLPMLFLGQIALTGLARDVWVRPEGGLLSFFFAAHPARGMADHPGASTVLYTPPGSTLAPARVDNPAGRQPALGELG